MLTEITPGIILYARTGDTTFEAVRISHNPGTAGIYFRVSCRTANGWHVSNERAHFRASKVAENLASGIWLTDPPASIDAWNPRH